MKSKELILFSFFTLWFELCGSKEGFDQLETYWLLFVILFFLYFKKIPPNYKTLIIFIFISNHLTRTPFLFILSLPFVVAGGKYEFLKNTTEILFTTSFQLNFNKKLLPKKPTIYLSNYPSNHVEYTANTLCSDKLCLVLGKKVSQVVEFVYGSENLIIVDKNCYDRVKYEIKNKINDGYDIFVYPERDFKKRKSKYDINKLRSGIFNIAKSLDVTITPLVFDHIEHCVGVIENNTYNIIVGETRKVNCVEHEMKEVSDFFKINLNNLKIK